MMFIKIPSELERICLFQKVPQGPGSGLATSPGFENCKWEMVPHSGPESGPKSGTGFRPSLTNFLLADRIPGLNSGPESGPGFGTGIEVRSLGWAPFRGDIWAGRSCLATVQLLRCAGADWFHDLADQLG